MTKEEARKLCQIIWEKQNMIPPFELLFMGYGGTNIHEWTEEDFLNGQN